MSADTDWAAALKNVDCVIHCAASAQVMYETKLGSLKAYRAVNVDETRDLTKQAAVPGVHRLAYLSSIKVNGEQTLPGECFTALENTIQKNPIISQNGKQRKLRMK